MKHLKWSFLSRRRRRLWWTGGSLLASVLAGAVAVLAIYGVTRPAVRRPGVDVPGITRTLSRSHAKDAPSPRFTDITSESGITFRSFAGRRSSSLPEDMGAGAAWGDFDNDGDDDLFLVSSGAALDQAPEHRAASELYENLGSGRFRLVRDFPETRIIGMGAAWADFDGDGWLDLVVSGFNSLLLFHNVEGRLVRHPGLPQLPGFWSGVSWGDFDNDRDLDLYVCGYVRYKHTPTEARSSKRSSKQYGLQLPFTLNPSSYKPERNLLFRNDGAGRFTEIAGDLGIANPDGRSLAALWHDFDGDGWTDLYVANDISDNKFYLNQGGTFEEISHAAWVADYRGAMGLAVGDWNGDGDDDLFISHWVAQENALYDSLLANQHEPPDGAPLRFVDVADRVGLGQIALPMVGWGAEFVDLDSDGWLDLVVANGSTFETADAQLRPQSPFLFWNRQGKSFYNLAPLDATLAVPHVGRGLAVSDWDNDGDLDLVFMNHGEGAQLLRNDMQTGGWVKIRLRSRLALDGPPVGRGVGTVLIAHVNGRRLRRCVTSASYLSQSSYTVHFGLGEAQRIDALEVRWPGGATMRYTDLEAATTWEVVEGDSTPHRVTARGNERQELTAFWESHRAAVRALKVDGDIPEAIRLFRTALSLRPDHEDSLYYLAQCLAQMEEVEKALLLFERAIKVNPASHRSLVQWGRWRAASATVRKDLEAAMAALEKAVSINPEETGALLITAEVFLLQGQESEADQRLEWICRTNRQAAEAFFLRGFLAWKRGELSRADELLVAALAGRAPAWKPAGTSAEGDVRTDTVTGSTLLSRFEENWSGSLDDLDGVFEELDGYLSRFDNRFGNGT